MRESTRALLCQWRYDLRCDGCRYFDEDELNAEQVGLGFRCWFFGYGLSRILTALQRSVLQKELQAQFKHGTWFVCAACTPMSVPRVCDAYISGLRSTASTLLTRRARPTSTANHIQTQTRDPYFFTAHLEFLFFVHVPLARLVPLFWLKVVTWQHAPAARDEKLLAAINETAAKVDGPLNPVSHARPYHVNCILKSHPFHLAGAYKLSPFVSFKNR